MPVRLILKRILAVHLAIAMLFPASGSANERAVIRQTTAPASHSASSELSALKSCEARADNELSRTEEKRRSLDPSVRGEVGNDQDLIRGVKRRSQKILSQRAADGCEKFAETARVDNAKSRDAQACRQTKLSAPKLASSGWKHSDVGGQPNQAKPQLSCDKSEKDAKATAEESKISCEKLKKHVDGKIDSFSVYVAKREKQSSQMTETNRVYFERDYEAVVVTILNSEIESQHKKCEKDLADLRDKNPLTKFLDKKELSAADIDEAQKKCAEEANKLRQATGRISTDVPAKDNKEFGRTLSLLGNRQAVDQVLQEKPELCGSYLKLRKQGEELLGPSFLSSLAAEGAGLFGPVSTTIGESQKLYFSSAARDAAKGFQEGFEAQGLNAAQLAAADKFKDASFGSQLREAGINIAMSMLPFGLGKAAKAKIGTEVERLGISLARAGDEATDAFRDALRAGEFSEANRYISYHNGEHRGIAKIVGTTDDGIIVRRQEEGGKIVDEILKGETLETIRTSSKARDYFRHLEQTQAEARPMTYPRSPEEFRSHNQKIFEGQSPIAYDGSYSTTKKYSYELPSGEDLRVKVVGNAKMRALGEDNITEHTGRANLGPGTYTFVALEDGTVVTGRVSNEWEVGVKHLNAADNRPVHLAGEIKVYPDGTYTYSTQSGTFSRPMLNSGQATQAELDERAGQVLEHLTGLRGNPTRVTLMPTNQPTLSEVRAYCSNRTFLAYNTDACCQIANICH